MDAQIFTTVATGAMLAMLAAILAWQGKGRLDTIERHLEQVRSELGSQIDSVRSEMAVMRSDLTHVALALGARPQTG